MSESLTEVHTAARMTTWRAHRSGPLSRMRRIVSRGRYRIVTRSLSDGDSIQVMIRIMDDLDSIIKAMYESVCYERGGHPDWETDERIFAPGARMVRINDGGVYEFDMPSYRADFERM